MFLVSLILASLSFTLFFPPYCASLSFHKGLAVEALPVLALPVLPQVSYPFASPTPSVLWNDRAVAYRRFGCHIWKRMPVPLCFSLSYSQFKRKVSVGGENCPLL